MAKPKKTVAKETEVPIEYFVPERSHYKTMEFIKDEDGRVQSTKDESTGIVTKVLQLSNPEIPAGKTVDPSREIQLHRVRYLHGKRVGYEILDKNEKLIETVDLSTDI